MKMKMKDVEKVARFAFAAGMVARDSGGEFSESNERFDSWVDDEAAALHQKFLQGNSK